MTATADLLAFAAAEHRLPPATRAATFRLLADTLAVGAAGASAPGATAVLEAAGGWGIGPGARLLGSTKRLPAPSAAFVNGFRIHCLEWDAVHEGAVVHALSVVVAAVGAAIDRRGACDREEALTAIAVGVDIAAGLGVAATGPLTFFRPAVAGTIGAALAVARIAGLAPAQYADVLGLAHAQCAGTMQAHHEGSIALPLQIAAAARNAVTAFDLVAAGLTGPHDALEGPFGHFALFDQGELATYTRTLGARWLIEEVSTKPWPCGRASHGVLGALSELRDELDGRRIAVSEARVPPLVKRLVGRRWNSFMSPASARLCLPMLAALMLRDGRIDPVLFTTDTLNDSSLLGPMLDFQIWEAREHGPNALTPQVLQLTLDDGRILRRDIVDVLGSPAAPMSAMQTVAKMALAREYAPADAPRRVFDRPLSYFTEGL